MHICSASLLEGMSLDNGYWRQRVRRMAGLSGQGNGGRSTNQRAPIGKSEHGSQLRFRLRPTYNGSLHRDVYNT